MKFQFRQWYILITILICNNCHELRDSEILNFLTIGESMKLTNYIIQQKHNFSQQCARIQTSENNYRRTKLDGLQLTTVVKSVNFPQDRAFCKLDWSNL
jgi:hypothetical protein